MPLVFSTFPELPASRQTVELEGDVYELRLHWQRRNQAWYCDLAVADGEQLFSGARISPRFGPTVGVRIDGLPPGQILAAGQDPYRRKDLGSGLFLLYATPEELAEFAPQPDASTPEIVT